MQTHEGTSSPCQRSAGIEASRSWFSWLPSMNRVVFPYYWGVQSRGEVEFVVRGEAGVVPIDAKNGTSRGGSLKRFVEKYGCPYGVALSRNNFGASERLHTAPLYAAFCVG